VVVLEAGDLIGGDSEIFVEVDGSLTKRGAEADQAQLSGPLHDWLMPIPWSMSLGVKIVEILTRPE
jgi:hypothetical protein